MTNNKLTLMSAPNEKFIYASKTQSKDDFNQLLHDYTLKLKPYLTTELTPNVKKILEKYFNDTHDKIKDYQKKEILRQNMTGNKLVSKSEKIKATKELTRIKEDLMRITNNVFWSPATDIEHLLDPNYTKNKLLSTIIEIIGLIAIEKPKNNDDFINDYLLTYNTFYVRTVKDITTLITGIKQNINIDLIVIVILNNMHYSISRLKDIHENISSIKTNVEDLNTFLSQSDWDYLELFSEKNIEKNI